MANTRNSNGQMCKECDNENKCGPMRIYLQKVASTRCWPNLRGMIQMTSATTDDEDNVYNGCFNYRRSPKGLLKLAKRLVVHLWRSSYDVDGWSDIMQLVEELHAGDIESAVPDHIHRSGRYISCIPTSGERSDGGAHGGNLCLLRARTSSTWAPRIAVICTSRRRATLALLNS